MKITEKIKQKVLNDYRLNISKIIRAKYKKKAYLEAKAKKIYFDPKEDLAKQFQEVQSEIYKKYKPIIEDEIKIKLEDFIDSERYEKAIENEINLSKRKLSYKILKRYQQFNINIHKKFLDYLYDEVNSDPKETVIKMEELHYIVLCIFYKIIDILMAGYRLKIGTILYIWLNKRDVRVNLPNVKSKIISDRLIPKIKLCNNFDRTLFLEINKNNQAIINYYKMKAERYLSLFKGSKK